MSVRECVGVVAFALLVVATSSIWKSIRHDRSIFIRIFGGLLVLTITLFNDSTVTAILAILFVATFITDTNFIENIAALVFGRKEFWDYRQATPEEVAANKIQESIEAGNKSTSLSMSAENNAVNYSKSASLELVKIAETFMEFESMVIEALHRDLGAFNIESNRIIQKKFGHKYFIDLLMTSELVDIIVEIKYASTSSGLQKLVLAAEIQLAELRKAYSSTLEKSKWIETAIVVPEVGEIYLDVIPRGSAVLVFDSGTKRFLNLDRLTDRLATGSSL